jgi:hypothetical protein
MIDALKDLFKQPYWVITLVLGAILSTLPCVTIDKDFRWTTHPPNTLLLAAIGVGNRYEQGRDPLENRECRDSG